MIAANTRYKLLRELKGKNDEVLLRYSGKTSLGRELGKREGCGLGNKCLWKDYYIPGTELGI